MDYYDALNSYRDMEDDIPDEMVDVAMWTGVIGTILVVIAPVVFSYMSKKPKSKAAHVREHLLSSDARAKRRKQSEKAREAERIREETRKLAQKRRQDEARKRERRAAASQ
jgi:uncharacterized membrane protein YhiD involved in acid resistance